MSKRNFILLIIVLIIITTAFYWFLYFQKGTPTNTDNGSDGTNFISQFNPFGQTKTPNTENKPGTITETNPTQTPETVKTKLMKISSVPIAGYTSFMKERLKEVPAPTTIPTTEEKTPVNNKAPSPKNDTEFSLALRYVEKSGGNIYQTFVDKIMERKFGGVVIPIVYDAYFGNKGNEVIMRYLKSDNQTIETFSGNLPKEYIGGDSVENNEIKGDFLPDNIKDISISPDNLKAFYLFNLKNSSGENQIGTILNFGDKKKTQVFDSPFTEWLSQWGNMKNINLTTKASGVAPGYMYSVDLSKKTLSQVFGGINGLTTLGSPDGKMVLYGDSSLSLYIYDINTKNSEPLQINTLPEKCVWGKASDIVYCAVPKSVSQLLYPDAWYQGEVSFNDAIWKIDLKNGNSTMLVDPETISIGERVDAIKMTLDEGENYLFFINKKDNFLWKLDLK